MVNNYVKVVDQPSANFLLRNVIKNFKYTNCHYGRAVLFTDAELLVRKGLNAFQERSDKWLLTLNINKCKIAFYGRVKYEHKYYL